MIGVLNIMNGVLNIINGVLNIMIGVLNIMNGVLNDEWCEYFLRSGCTSLYLEPMFTPS